MSEVPASVLFQVRSLNKSALKSAGPDIDKLWEVVDPEDYLFIENGVITAYGTKSVDRLKAVLKLWPESVVFISPPDWGIHYLQFTPLEIEWAEGREKKEEENGC